MVVATEVVARRYLDVVTGQEISVNIQLYRAEEVFVYYGNAALVAVANTDFAVTLSPDFNTFTLEVLAPLKAKIDALIAADATETNFIVVRRELDNTTEATPAGVRTTEFTSREFDRTVMRLQQIDERLSRALVFPETLIGGVDAQLNVGTVTAGQVLQISDDGTKVETSGYDISTFEDFTSQAVQDVLQVKADIQAMFDAIPGNLVGTEGAQDIFDKTFVARSNGAVAATFEGFTGDAGRMVLLSDRSAGVVSVLGGSGRDDGGGVTGYGSVQFGILVNTAGVEEGYVQFAPTTAGSGVAQMRVQGGLVRPIGNVDLGQPATAWQSMSAQRFMTSQWADWHGATGDGVTNDATAITAAFNHVDNAGLPIVLTKGKTYRFVGVPPEGITFAGDGRLVYEEGGSHPVQQTWGNIIFAGTPNTRGGIQRAMRSAGLFLGEAGDRRGVLINNQGCSSYVFFREQSDEGQSLLNTLMPTPRYERVQGVQGTNTMQPVSGDFNLSFFQVGRRVQVNGLLCRITAAALDSCTVKKDPTILAAGEVVGVDDVIAWDTDFVDSALIPQHVWPCTANVNGTAVTITAGVPEDLNVIPSEVMIKIDGTYYQVVSATNAYNLVIDTSLPAATGKAVEVSWQREYMVQDTMKWNGGEHEQTYKVGLTAAYIEFDSSNSGQSTRAGVQWHRGFQFSVDNVPKFQVDEDRVRSLVNMTVVGDISANQVFADGSAVVGFIRPTDSTQVSDVGSGNFPFRHGYFRTLRVGTPGNINNGVTGSANSSNTLTIQGGLVVGIS